MEISGVVDLTNFPCLVLHLVPTAPGSLTVRLSRLPPLFPKKIILSREKRTTLWFYYSDYHSCMFIYLWSIICDCAKEAERKGYRVFGIQFYGECWGSHSFIPSHRYRPVRRCIDEQFKTCAKNGWNSTCTGKNWANFIYKLQQVCVWFTFACFFIDNFEVCVWDWVS